MATRKDQLDAFVFARRRMVANLVAPSPTGSDEGAPRPVKTFFTSAILSAIAVAGVAVLGVFKPSAPSGWEKGLAVDSSSGAAYVYSAQDKQLHPIVNITSARLLLGSNFKKFDVPDSVINGPDMTIGVPFGIPFAPPDVPTASNVDLTQWNLCLQSKNTANQAAGGGKTVLEIGFPTTNETPVDPGGGFVVHDSNNVNYLVNGDYAYPIQDTAILDTLTGAAVGSSGVEGPWVSSAWLKVFAPGAALQFPTLHGIGDPLPSKLSAQPGTLVGDYGQLPAQNGGGDYVWTETGLVEVNAFVYALYIASPDVSNKHVKQLTLTPSQITAAQAHPELTDASASFGNAAADWPQRSVLTFDSDGVRPGFGVFCVTYSGGFEADGVPRLSLSYGTSLPQSSSAAVLQSGGGTLADFVLVKAGHAALARDVSNGNTQNVGAQYLVTDTGMRYPMSPGKAAQNGQDKQPSAAEMLLYTNVKITAVPDSWMRLVQGGSSLDPQAAGQPMSTTE